MFAEIRGTHQCYLCRQSMPWVGHLFGEGVIAHGSEVVVGIAVSGPPDAQNRAPINVKLVCPYCGGKNAIQQEHTLE